MLLIYIDYTFIYFLEFIRVNYSLISYLLFLGFILLGLKKYLYL